MGHSALFGRDKLADVIVVEARPVVGVGFHSGRPLRVSGSRQWFVSVRQWSVRRRGPRILQNRLRYRSAFSSRQ